MRNLRLILIVSAAFGLAWFISGCTINKATEKVENGSKPVEKIDKRGTRVGQLAPAFKLTKTDGGEVSLDSLKGNVSVLVFWSAYCIDCEKEAPHINKLAKEFESKGVQVLGINIGESEARTLGGIKDFGIEYDVARDEGRKITQKYNVLGTPTVIFLDKRGYVKYNGNKLPDDYAERLNTLTG